MTCLKKSVRVGDLIITTGEILRVGESHFEHNINTVAGHSGATVYLYQPGHPYHLKAIALHVGYKDSLKANIAFKLKGLSFEQGAGNGSIFWVVQICPSLFLNYRSEEEQPTTIPSSSMVAPGNDNRTPS